MGNRNSVSRLIKIRFCNAEHLEEETQASDLIWRPLILYVKIW